MLHRIPGFRSHTWWKTLVASGAYLFLAFWAVLFIAVGYWPVTVWLLMFSGLVIALVTDAESMRTRTPVFRSPSLPAASAAWIGLGIFGVISFTVVLSVSPSSVAGRSAIPSPPPSSQFAEDRGANADQMGFGATVPPAPTATPMATATPTPIARAWTPPNQEYEVGFGTFNAIKMRLLGFLRTNKNDAVNDDLELDENDEFIVITIQYRSTQGGAHTIDPTEDFFLEGVRRARPLPSTALRMPDEALQGTVPLNQETTGNLVFQVSAGETFGKLVYTAGRTPKEIDVTAGSTPIKPPVPTATLGSAALAAREARTSQAQAHVDAASQYLAANQPGLALIEVDQALAVQPTFAEGLAFRQRILAQAASLELDARAQTHVDAASDYRRSGQLGLALVELQQALAIQPNYGPAAELQNEVRPQATAVVQQANAQATAAIQQEQAAVRATINAYARVPPRGEWGTVVPGIAVVARNFSYDTRIGFQTAPRGYRFVSFGLAVLNGGSSILHVNPFNATLIDQTGRSHAHDAATYSCQPPLQAVDVRPGDHAAGCIAFAIPANTGPARLIYRTNLFTGRDVVVDFERPPDKT